MIRYALVCAQAHRFESWFRDSDAFDALAAAGQLACPACGSAEVGKALMAPSVVTSRSRSAAQAGPPRAPVPASPPSSPTPPSPAAVLGEREARLRAMLRDLHREVTEKAENVGATLAVEARRIHDGEAPARSIYGEATREEVRDLLEDGIPVLPLPVLPEERN